MQASTTEQNMGGQHRRLVPPVSGFLRWQGRWVVSSPAGEATLKHPVTAAIERGLGGVASRVSVNFRPSPHDALEEGEQVQLVRGAGGGEVVSASTC